MEELGLYLLKSALCSTAFLSIYVCFFKNETFYRFNRFFLLTGLLCSFILPLYTYTYEVSIPVAEVPVNHIKEGLQGIEESDSIWIYGLMCSYGLGVFFLLLRHFIGLVRIKKVIDSSGYSSRKGYRLVEADDFKSSFSFFNYIIMDGTAELSVTERKLVMEHELAHVKQQHWADLLLAQGICALQWFNPVAWLYLRAVRENHEFLADEAVLKQGNSPAIYRAVLVNHCIGTRVFSFSSSFYQYQLNRIKMLAKPASGSVKKFAALAVLPALAVFLWAFSRPVFTIQQQLTKASQSAQKEKGASDALPAKLLKVQVSPQLKPGPSAKKKAKVMQEVKAVSVKDTVGKASVMVSDKVVVSAQQKPLYLLDGVEIPPVIGDVDQAIIESIHVLKDEQAVAAYGERGRNGVILIYTKKPKAAIE